MDVESLSPEKRAQILEGAAIVFDEDGYEGASMQRIAKEANVSKGTLYNHFASKADLFKAHVEQSCGRYFCQVFGPLDAAAPLEETLRGIGHRLVRLLTTPMARTIYRMVISEAEAFPELAEAFYAAGPMAALKGLSRYIAQAAAEGLLQTPDPDFAAEQFYSLCQTHLALRYRLHLDGEPGEAAVARVVDEAVSTFLARYGVKAGRL